jgi:hypothetical protein
MPEIAEAQALVAALAEMHQVKAEAARRERRLRLESSFAQAVGWSKGFAAAETKAAVGRVADALATDGGDGVAPVAAHQAHWASAMMRGEVAPAREAAKKFLKAAESVGVPWDLAAAHRSMGATLLVAGDLAEASRFLRQAMEAADRGYDRHSGSGTAPDPGSSAAAHLSLASWVGGEPDLSRALIENALARAQRIELVPTVTVARYLAALREMLRGDARQPAARPLDDRLLPRAGRRAVPRRGNGDSGLGASASRS